MVDGVTGFGVPRSARLTFVLLFALMAVDFADRQVLVAAFPYLRAEWGLTDTELGALASVLAVTVAVGALPTAILVDRWSRVRAIALMGAVWSVGAAASGLAQGYGQLLAARVVVGAGEAGYRPAGGALLTTAYPAGRRATALGAFQAAAPLGTVIGAALGSAVAAAWGWRWAVALLALPGLVLALLMLLVPDYQTVRPARPGARAAVRALLRARSAVGAVFGGTLLLIVVSAFYTWLPTQLERTHGLLPAQAGNLTAVFVLAGVIGTIGWAVAADRLARRDARRKLTVPAVAALATFVLLGTASRICWPPRTLAVAHRPCRTSMRPLTSPCCSASAATWTRRRLPLSKPRRPPPPPGGPTPPRSSPHTWRWPGWR